MSIIARVNPPSATKLDSSPTLLKYVAGKSPLKISEDSRTSSPRTERRDLPSGNNKRGKMLRKKLFEGDEENASPVLGLRILPAAEPGTNRDVDKSGSKSPTTNDTGFTCKLCKTQYRDPLQLANHRCVRIENVQYACPECGKSFGCPANLASHRRWHKPKREHPSNSNSRPATAESTKEKHHITKNNLSQKSNVMRGDHSTAAVENYTTRKIGNDATKQLQSVDSICEKHFNGKSYTEHHVSSKQTGQESMSDFASVTQQSNATVCTGPPGPIIFHNEFGGLVALAFAAEMHSRLSPECRSMGNLEMKESQETISKRISSETSSGDAPQRKAVKIHKGHQVNTTYVASQVPAWLPPSPPRSDLSCSPRSVISDSNDEKVPTDSSSLNFGLESSDINLERNPGHSNHLLKQVVVKSTPKIMQHNSSVNPTNTISNYSVNIPSYIPFHHTHSVANFHEPYHPFVFASFGSCPRPNLNGVLVHWKSLTTPASTAWKSPTDLPYFYPS